MSLQATTNQQDESYSTTVWNPSIRKLLSGVALLGAAETAYLTYAKLFGDGGVLLCSADGASSCSSVLDGPYATLGDTGVPLSLLGFFAYATVAILAAYPLFYNSTSTSLTSSPSSNNNNDMDATNRLALLGLTSAMATFSTVLMYLLFFTLQASCQFCITSAVFSITLAALTWFGGAASPSILKSEGNGDTPKRDSSFAGAGVASVLLTLVLASTTFLSPTTSSTSTMKDVILAETTTPSPQPPSSSSSSLIASLSSTLSPSPNPQQPQPQPQQQEPPSPPPITTTSSTQALHLATNLQSLHTRFFGAYWCSHCYEQKQTLGQQAMSKIPYIECSQEGKNSQREGLCKEKKIPGYPTWEIGGRLFPGERSLEELEEIVGDMMPGK